jgi:hypothetical protein
VLPKKVVPHSVGHSVGNGANKGKKIEVTPLGYVQIRIRCEVRECVVFELSRGKHTTNNKQ